MGNATGAFGLQWVYSFNGGGKVLIPCYIAASYATALYIGDPVKKSDEADDMDATGYRFSVEHGGVADAAVIFGVIAGFNELQTDLSKQYNPASTERIAYVIPADGSVFRIRGGGGGTVTDLFPGENAIMLAGTSSTVTGMSGVMLDEGSGTAPSADQSNPLYILNIENKPDNTLGSSAIYHVLINTPYNATGRTLGIVAS